MKNVTQKIRGFLNLLCFQQNLNLTIVQNRDRFECKKSVSEMDTPFDVCG